MFKVTVKFPDDQYIPENIELVDKTFDDRNKAIDHIETQYDIFCDWMNDDPSCITKPLYETSVTDNSIDGIYRIIISINNGACCCEFKVERISS